tara:strand:+ start:96679 stop:96906 length:228 start_codon:yes stop_codon:yes gene_type:complete
MQIWSRGFHDPAELLFHYTLGHEQHYKNDRQARYDGMKSGTKNFVTSKITELTGPQAICQVTDPGFVAKNNLATK